MSKMLSEIQDEMNESENPVRIKIEKGTFINNQQPGIFIYCDKNHIEGDKPFQINKDKLLLISVIGSRFLPDSGNVTKIYAQVVDENQNILSRTESVMASLISDLSEPSYNLTVQFPTGIMENSITAYLTITVVTFGDIESFLQKRQKGDMPEPVILSFTCFNLFTDDDDCSRPLNTREYIENGTQPDKKWIRFGNYQLKMFQPNYLDESLVEFCTLKDSFILDHIPAYSTLITINEISLQDFEMDQEDLLLLPDLKVYGEGNYFNAYTTIDEKTETKFRNKHGYYETEMFIMGSLSKRIPIRVDEFISEILELEEFKLKLPSPETDRDEDLDQNALMEQEIKYQKDVSMFLKMEGDTLLADDIGLFKFPVLSQINVAVDMLYNIIDSGIYIVSMHYITDKDLHFEKVAVIQDINLDSNVKAIEYDFGYFVLNPEEYEIGEKANTLMFTVLKIEASEDEPVKIIPEAFTFLPLYLSEDVILQGTFQLPLFRYEVSSEIFELIQDYDSWNLQSELTKRDSDIKPSSMSLLMRIRLPEFEGWKEDPSDFRVVNKMFMPDSKKNSSLITYENYFELIQQKEETIRDLAKGNFEQLDDIEALAVEYFISLQKEENEYSHNIGIQQLKEKMNKRMIKI